jgi:tetratricopeptide (TPR) repeat protein
MPPADLDERAAVAETTNSSKKQPSLASGQPVADLEHPWLGLESFREETRVYFFGRDAEISELRLRVRGDPLLVLHGRSGLGKTSILLAGLIPKLREEGRRPLLFRLRYGESAQDVRDQLVSAVFGFAHKQSGPGRQEPETTESLLWTRRLSEKLHLPLPEDVASRLWLRLHHRGEPPGITHLILDQFEEVFTLGALQSGAEARVRDMLAILLQGAVPEPIGRLISEDDSFGDYFDPDSIPVRIILALRSDFVYALNRWRRHLPALGQNSFELRALRGPAAFDAVFKPGELRCHYRSEVNEQSKVETGLQPIITHETAQRIVRFVAEKGEDIPIGEIEAVPPILSLLCRELNQRRFTEPAGTSETPASQIAFRETEADIQTIIAAFYERCLGGHPEAVRIFIEEELVSYSGARLAQDEVSFLRVFEEGYEVPGAPDDRRAPGFGDPTAARACLEELVNQRLLSSVGGSGNPSYELIHDLLAAVVERSRTSREERLEKEEADRRAEAERQAKNIAEGRAREAAEQAAVLDKALKQETQARREADRATRRARWLAIAAILVAFIAVALFFVALKAWTDARAAKDRAVASRKAANELINFMQYDLSKRLGTLGHLDIMDAVNARIMKYHEDHPPEIGDLDELRERGVALIQQGEVQRDQGDLVGALKSFRDSFAITDKLAKQDPGNALWQRDLSVSYIKVGDVQSAQGDLAGALKSYRDSLAIAEKLAKQDPDNVLWQGDLSVSYIKVGDVQSAQGDLAGALKSYRDSLAIAEKLAKQGPDNDVSQRDLFLTYARIGDVQRAQGDLAGALESYRNSLGIAEKLSKYDPDNVLFQGDLVAGHSSVGDVQSAQGDLSGALASYRAMMAIAEKLAKQDTGNPDWQRNLSASHEKVGDVLSAQSDHVDALENYRQSLAIVEKLTKQDPSNALWQHDLSDCYKDVGGALNAQEDISGALESYRESLAIREKLGKQDPGNVGWQADLAYSYWKTGEVWSKVDPRSKKESRAMVEKGRHILRELKKHTGLTIDQQNWLNAIEADLQKMDETS